MALDKYTNKETIDTSGQSRGEFIESKDNALIKIRTDNKIFNQTGSINDSTTKDFIETHIYDTDGRYLAYNSSDPTRMSEKYTDSGVLPISYTHNNGVINLNLAEETRKLGFTQGKYITTTNVLQTVLSGNVYIDEISPSRKEIRIRPVDGRFQNDYFQKYHILNEFYFYGIKSKLVDKISEVLALNVDFNDDGTVNVLDIVSAVNTFNNPQFAIDNGLVDVNGNPLELDVGDFQVIIDYILYLILGGGGSWDISDPQNPVPKPNPFVELQDGIFGGEEEERLFNIIKEQFHQTALKLMDAKDIQQVHSEKLNFFANFGDNNLQLITNWMVDDVKYSEWPFSIILKLYKPLPDGIEVRNQFELVEAYSKPLIEKINLVGFPQVEEELIDLGPYNEKLVGQFSYDAPSVATDFENYNDLLSVNPDTSTKIINTFLSQSIGDVKVNVDYNEFENFVNFSSIEERLENFRYKLKLIETYDNKISELASVTSSTISSTSFLTKKNALIGDFDGYEKHLYYNSSSGDSSDINAQVNFSTGSNEWNTYAWPTTFPKTTSTYPYTLASVHSTAGKNWFNGAIASASAYDRDNAKSLRNNLPLHIREDKFNDQFILFMDMIGQHFDILWSYVNHMTEIHQRDEGVFEGLHKDLVYHVGKSFGLKFKNGGDLFELWKAGVGENIYKEGLVNVSASGVTLTSGASWNPNFNSGSIFVADIDGNGTSFTSEIRSVTHTSASLQTYYSGSVFDKSYALSYTITGSQDESLSQDDASKEIWKRILNNLPYLMKSKGTSRSIKALLSCYGIPQTLLSIREYGGPTTQEINNPSLFVDEVLTYGLHFTGSDQHATLPWTASSKEIVPDTIQLRFVPTGQYEASRTTRLFQSGDGEKPLFDLRLLPSSTSSFGRLAFRLSGSDGYKSVSSSKLPLFNNDDGESWLATLTRTSSSDATNIAQTYKLFVQKAIDDRIPFKSETTLSFDASTSSSYKASYTSSNTLTIGTDGASYDSNFSGSILGFRLWSAPLSESVIDNHTRAPFAYNGNTTESFYNDLEFYQRFNKRINHDVYPYAENLSFKTSYTSSIQTVNFGDDNQSYREFEISNNYEVPNLGPSRFINNKIRVESTTLDGQLSPYNRREKRAYDFAPLDSPKLGVYFSPTQPIDNDIIADLAGISTDDLVGDPGDRYQETYVGLNKLRDIYFKRYDALDKFQAYIKLIDYYDRTLFEQIRDLIPERAHESVGLLIEPHILERSKVAHKRPSVEEPNFDDTILEPEKILTGSLDNPEGTAGPVASWSGDFDQLEGTTPEVIQTTIGSLETDEGNIINEPYKPTSSFDSLRSTLSNVPSKSAAANYDDLNQTIVFEKSSISESVFSDNLSDNINMSTDHFKITSQNVGGDSQVASYPFQGKVNTSAGYKNTHFDTMRYTGSHGEEEHLMPIIMNQRLSDKYIVPTNSIDNLTIGFSRENSKTGDYRDSNGFSQQFLSSNYQFNTTSSFSASVFNGQKTGFVPAEYQPSHEYSVAVNNVRYEGCKNTIDTTTDGKEPIEVFETAPSQLVVSNTSGNTLQVQ